jgi:hypothetical protein
MNEPKRQAIRAYFAPFPRWAVWSAGASVAGILVQGWFFAYGLGWIVIVIAVWTVKQWSHRPTDAEMDAWVREDLDNLTTRVLEKSSLDASQQIRKPVTITSPRLRDLGGARFGICRGRDRKLRFTPMHTTVINFTEHQLVLYQCALDLMTGKPLNECVDEYFYQDVVSVSTESQSLTLAAAELDQTVMARWPGIRGAMVDGRLQLNRAETFVLTTSGATSVRVVLRDPILIASLGSGTLATEPADPAVQAVRQMLRDKKAR